MSQKTQQVSSAKVSVNIKTLYLLQKLDGATFLYRNNSDVIIDLDEVRYLISEGAVNEPCNTCMAIVSDIGVENSILEELTFLNVWMQ